MRKCRLDIGRFIYLVQIKAYYVQMVKYMLNACDSCVFEHVKRFGISVFQFAFCQCRFHFFRVEVARRSSHISAELLYSNGFKGVWAPCAYKQWHTKIFWQRKSCLFRCDVRECLHLFWPTKCKINAEQCKTNNLKLP